MTIIASAAGAILSAEATIGFMSDGSPWWLPSLWVIIALAFAGTCGLLCLRSARACGLALAALALLIVATGFAAFGVLDALTSPEEAGILPGPLLALLPLLLPVAFWAYVARDIFRLRQKGELS